MHNHSSRSISDGVAELFHQVLLSEAQLDQCFQVHKEQLRQLQEQIQPGVGRPHYVSVNATHTVSLGPKAQLFSSIPNARRPLFSRTSTNDSLDSRAFSSSPMCLLEFWGQKRRTKTTEFRVSMFPTFSTDPSEAKPSLQAGDTVRGHHLDWLVINPTSKFRMAWDVISAQAIFYDVITVPLMVFGYDKLPLAYMIGVGLSLFWIFDLMMTFFVGFWRQDGGVEMRMNSIARRYIRTWFPLDVCLIFADAVVYLLESFNSSGEAEAIRLSKALRGARWARFLRVLRLTRVLKLTSLIEEFCDVMVAASAVAFFNIVKLILGVALFAHFIACAWYYIGESVQQGWVQRMDEENAGVFYRYISAYHWTMAQFTPAPSDIHPRTMEERAFAVVVLFMGFVIFSSLLGSTTALISQARAKVVAQTKSTESLRRFFVENHVSLELAARIMRMCRADLKGKRRVKENDLIMLKSLPLSVQLELRYQVYCPLLAKAPFFGALAKEQPLVIPDLCHSAMQEVAVNLNEELFHYGTRGTHVYFVVNGHFMYYPGPIAISNIEPPAQKVIDEEEMLAEAVLWVYWEHRGQLTASSQSDVVKVDADVFRRFVRKTTAFAWLREYAFIFTHLGNHLPEEPDLDDTWRPFETADEVVENLCRKFSRSAVSFAQPESGTRPDTMMNDPSMSAMHTSRSSEVIEEVGEEFSDQIDSHVYATSEAHV